jgi:transposase-like protein
MSRKPFTSEEINILLQNPFTYKVTNSTISFTKEFKQIFIEKYLQGMIPRQILKEHGYDPDILGDRRIWGIAQHLKAQYAEAGGSFTEGYSQRKRTQKSAGQLSEKEELKQLRQEVDYLKQEIEFLKKISSIRTTRK